MQGKLNKAITLMPIRFFTLFTIIFLLFISRWINKFFGDVYFDQLLFHFLVLWEEKAINFSDGKLIPSFLYNFIAAIATTAALSISINKKYTGKDQSILVTAYYSAQQYI